MIRQWTSEVISFMLIAMVAGLIMLSGIAFGIALIGWLAGRF